MRRLILRTFQSPGDIVMLTAAVRDLHAAAPGQFQTAVRTSADALWENNPHLTPLHEGEQGVEVLDMHYPLIHHSNQRPYHFLHGYAGYLEQQLGLSIPVTRFQGDIYLSAAEREAPPPGAEAGVPDRFWIVVAGGKYDFTAKWWNPDSYQQVVDHFRDRLVFVQCGEAGHWHPRLRGVVDLVGKTSLRDFVRLMYRAEGVLCGVTFAMHLAAAVPVPPGRRTPRACVVVAGAREPPHWEAYPQHQFLSTAGMLPCCAEGGCWRSRCQTVGDGDDKDRRELCLLPVDVSPGLRIPRCMSMITPADVIRRIELYLEGAAVSLQTTPAPAPVSRPAKAHLLLEFRHGLGDAVQLTVVLQHLRHFHPDWDVDVAALPGKESAFRGLCRHAFVLDRDAVDRSAYQRVLSLDWPEYGGTRGEAPRTKPTRCLQEVFGLAPLPQLCRYRIDRGEAASRLARDYLAGLCPQGPRPDGRFPVLLLHYQANTSAEHKDLPHELAQEVCSAAQEAGLVPVILDWDRRSPLPDGAAIHNPDADHPLWAGRGTGDAETLAALIEASAFFVGVDSGPLHVAAATTTPTVAIWTGHHPLHFFDLADNVLHLVPGDHARHLHEPSSRDYFQSHYRHRVYKQLSVELLAVLDSLMTGEDVEQAANRRFLARLRSTAFDERYYREHKLAGLDYLGFGDWQERYGRWLIEALGWHGRRVLDVGCACGSILRGLGQAGAVVQGVDVNEHMIGLGRRQWPDMAGLLHVCDAVNLHLYAEGSWEGIHTAQVAEHWRPELVPFILRELARVAAPEGLLFCCLDTEELFTRQGRRPEAEDPTHVCIRPLAWWHERLVEAGWQVCSADFEAPLRQHTDSFLRLYDWDWIVARRLASCSPLPSGERG